MELFCIDEDGFRGMNYREDDALVFTFGIEVGQFFSENIKLEYDQTLVTIPKKGRVRTDMEIKMRSEYNPELLRWLGIFIHEATHIWQRETNRYRTGPSGKNYRYSEAQVRGLNLEREQHARAVQDWFYVNYGIHSGMIGKPNQVDGKWIWDRVMEDIYKGKTNYLQGGAGLPYVRRIVNHDYKRLMEEVRNPDHL